MRGRAVRGEKAAWAVTWRRARRRVRVKERRSGSGRRPGGLVHEGADGVVDEEETLDLLLDAVGRWERRTMRGPPWWVLSSSRDGLDFPALVVQGRPTPRRVPAPGR